MPQPALSAEAYRDLLSCSPSPVIVHDAAGRIVEANHAFADLLGYSHAEVQHLDAGAVIHSGDRAVRDADAQRLLDGHADRLATERRLVRKDGTVVRARVRKAAATTGGRRLVMVIIEDWTEDYLLTEELRQAVYTDDLTGVLNRRGVWRHLDDLADTDLPQVLALIDVDGLKATNDESGHAAGDTVLRTIASRLEGLLGPGAVAARLSGDEFLVLAPVTRWTERTLADAVADRVSGTTTDPNSGERLSTSVSVGVTTMDRAEDFTAALARADAAMYADKARHADRIDRGHAAR